MFISYFFRKRGTPFSSTLSFFNFRSPRVPLSIHNNIPYVRKCTISTDESSPLSSSTFGEFQIVAFTARCAHKFRSGQSLYNTRRSIAFQTACAQAPKSAAAACEEDHNKNWVALVCDVICTIILCGIGYRLFGAARHPFYR